MDVVKIIEAEHRQVERLFERFERAVHGSDRAAQAELGREILRALSMHASVEEQVLYPALRRVGLSAERLDALEDHHSVKVVLAEIQALTPESERFAPKMHLVEKSTRLHIQEEETALLPRLGEALAPEELERLGEEFESLRRFAPTRPHPTSPDSPPANIVVNAAVSLVDRAQDSLAEAGNLVRTAARGLVASAVRAGREAADRTRQNGEALAVQARAVGERTLNRARMLRAEVVEGVAERGQDVAERIERRTTSAARELTHGAEEVRAQAKRSRGSARARNGRSRKGARRG